MVTLSFNGAVTEKNMLIYSSVFNEERVNPNGCTAKGTFFVSHKYTNYSAVQVRELSLLPGLPDVLCHSQFGYERLSIWNLWALKFYW